MRFASSSVVLLALISAAGCGSKDGDSGSSSSDLAGSWTLKNLAAEGSNAQFQGSARVEYRDDGSYVFYEDGFAVAANDYGPCWDVLKGIYSPDAEKLTTTIQTQQAREGCATESSAFGPNTSTIKIDGDTLVETTADGLVYSYARDVPAAALDYDALVGQVQAHPNLKNSASADATVEDKNTNDNLKLLLTECDLDPATSTNVILYYSSEAMGVGKVIKTELKVPKFDKWTDGKFTKSDTASECNAPGLRIFDTADVQVARTSNDFSALYGCGATCTYSLVSEKHDADGVFSEVELTWSCTDVGHVTKPGIFGLAVDKHAGKAKCPTP